MKLKDLLEKIDNTVEMVLCDEIDIDIGIFRKEDKGLKQYIDGEVILINLFDNRLIITLKDI